MAKTTKAIFTQADLIALFADPAVRADPFPLYHRLREADPVHRSFVGFWVLSRYDDVTSVLHDPRHSSDERNVTSYQGPSEPTAFQELFYRLLLFTDEPDHTRLRGLVQKAFTRRVIEALRPRIEAIVSETLERLVREAEFDLLSAFAYPVPVAVICELLGVPFADRDRFRSWAHDLAGRFEIQPLRTPEGEARGDAATAELIAYFDELVRERRRRPGDDLISELIAAEEAGDRLTPDELYATCILLLMAGHETTANLVGNGMLALMRHRDQWTRLREDRSLLRSGIEELLRFAGPVQLTERIAMHEIRLGDVQIERGEGIGLMLAAANRDPERFADPDRLDVGREDNQHIAFSAGPHFCLGAPLARLEAQIMLDGILDRMPGIELVSEPEWRETFVLRGLKSLNVRDGSSGD